MELNLSLPASKRTLKLQHHPTAKFSSYVLWVMHSTGHLLNLTWQKNGGAELSARRCCSV